MSGGDVVVLLHGLWMGQIEQSVLRYRLDRQHGFDTHVFYYRSVTEGLEQNVSALHDYLESLGAGKIHLVGHSLGGVLIVSLFDRMPEQKPGRVVLLGSPVKGSDTARRAAELPLGKQVIGRSVEDRLLGRHEPSWQAEHEVGIIAGTRSLGVGRVLGLTDTPNDGTVAVAETRLPGARAHLELPVSHTGLLFSSEVADRTARFLKTGAFDK